MHSIHPASAAGSANAPASATDVSRVLGDVDPIVVERIVATGASLHEIGEALREEIDEISFDEAHAPSSPRVTEVRRLIEELVLYEPDDAEPSV